MTEIDLIIDLHKRQERQGPGSADETLKALGFTDLQEDRLLKVADIGCGSGSQTITLAQNLNAKIMAIDLFSAFLNQLNKRTGKLQLSDAIETRSESMDNLPFNSEEFDLIWSEGAIYNMGFKAGIRSWKNFIKPGGYLGVSEITWITQTRPPEIEEYWNEHYPEIDTASNKIRILEDSGYTLAGYFCLEKSSWIDNYYRPLESEIGNFLLRHPDSELAKQVADEATAEFDLYKKYSDYFSYGFYVAKKDLTDNF